MIERSRLFQQCAGNPQLSNVVQQTCNKNLVVFFRVNPASCSHLVPSMQNTGGMGDSGCMRCGKGTEEVGEQREQKTERVKLVLIKDHMRIAYPQSTFHFLGGRQVEFSVF